MDKALEQVSHLLQMRGLKQIIYTRKPTLAMSHLLQMRGLKPVGKYIPKRKGSRIFYRCVD